MNLAKVKEIKAVINALSHDEALCLWGWFSDRNPFNWLSQQGLIMQNLWIKAR